MGKPEKRVSIKEEPDTKESHDGPSRWDDEEDHLLSYFLEDGMHSSTARHRSDSDADPHQPPTTPAVHFYAAPTKSHSSSDSLSMTSMAAALVSGGPLIPPPDSKEDDGDGIAATIDSPISPAAIIGTAQENLMLPPPAGDRTEAEKQQHLAWLNHINAMAHMSRQGTHAPHATQQQHHHHHGPPQPQPQGSMPMPQGYPIMPVAFPPPQARPPAAETEERRARRLARNRESARQSRRRKKERLTTLEKKVHDLFTQVEQERRHQISGMEKQLQLVRSEQLESMDVAKVTRKELQELLRETSPNCTVRERVASFQYSNLRQLLLPRNQEFLLWLTLQPDGFFMQAKEEKIKGEKTTGRVSSKQIGEELTTEWKKGEQDEESGSGEGDEGDKSLSSRADDVTRMWPLLCYELAISVDQEERLVQTQKRTRDIPSLPDDRLQMALATKMATNMKKGVLFQGHAASMRTDTTLLEILTPEQSVKFLRWMSANKERCREMIGRRSTDEDTAMKKETTLSDLCRRLDEVLRLPKGNDETEESG